MDTRWRGIYDEFETDRVDTWKRKRRQRFITWYISVTLLIMFWVMLTVLVLRDTAQDNAEIIGSVF